MGSNPYDFIEEDLPCPVCGKSLSIPGAPPKLKSRIKKKRTKGPLHLNQAQKDTKKTKDDEEIVVAQCGHLFHKFCLRHYCYLYREGQSNPMCRVNCPVCQRNISMMSSAGIEYKRHQDRITHREKEYIQTSIMHSELSGQFDSANKKLDRLSEQVGDGGSNLEMFSTHLRKIKSDMKQARVERLKSDSLKYELQQTDKMLSFMQAQHLKIVKKFITKVKQKSPKDYLFFPRRLAPYLSIIEVDNRMVRDLGEIIVPIHLNNLKSDRQSLLKGILTTVNARIEEQKAIQETKRSDRGRQKLVRIQKVDPPQTILQPRVIVKVRKSSVSILSSSILTKESIQKIIKHVKHIPERARKRIYIEDPDGKKNVTEEGAVLEHFSSASDVKILFMPKRAALHQYSEPCRIVEENDSFHVKVPTRRCKSTDAVIIKTKKAKKKESRAKESRCKSSVPSERQRSNSIAKICPSKKDFERIEKLEILLLNAEPETAQGDACVAQPNHEARLEEEEIVTITNKEYPQKYMSDVNNNMLFDEDLVAPPPPPAFADGSPRQPQNVIAVGHCETDMPVELTTSDLISPCTSLLEMIYDELEEEKNFKASQSFGSMDWDSNRGPSYELSQSRLQDDPDEEWIGQSPRFFRVDKRGVLHPQDPGHSNYRHPTFLGSTYNMGGSDVAGGCIESDEENQLNTLSFEERISLAAEKENVSGLNKNLFSARRRPIFHGIPACMGMPGGQFCSEVSRPSHSTPTYMRRWQQQLSARRSSKKGYSTHRILASQLNPTIPQSAATMTPRRQQNVCQQRQLPNMVREETERSYLPPLSMYPAKRPSTADCGKGAAADDGDCTRPATEMFVGGNYDSFFHGSESMV